MHFPYGSPVITTPYASRDRVHMHFPYGRRSTYASRDRVHMHFPYGRRSTYAYPHARHGQVPVAPVTGNLEEEDTRAPSRAAVDGAHVDLSLVTSTANGGGGGGGGGFSIGSSPVVTAEAPDAVMPAPAPVADIRRPMSGAALSDKTESVHELDTNALSMDAGCVVPAPGGGASSAACVSCRAFD